MATANVGPGKSGSYLVDMSSADDLWRKLADSTPVPHEPAQTLQRVSRRSARPPQFNAMETTTGGVERVRAVQTKSAGFVSSAWDKRPPSVEMPADPWSRGERRLWFVAGSLMALAVAVLTVFAIVTFGGVHTAVASATPVSPIPGMPEMTAPVATAAPTAHDANTFRPPLPARVRAESPKPAAAAPAVARKHVNKHHKAKRIARN